jgi:hypothetical protein
VKRTPAAVLAALMITVVALLAGCGSQHSSASPQASTYSSGAAAAANEVSPVLEKCMPANQLELLISSGTRHKFADCLAIPPANRSAFLVAVLNAVEAYHAQSAHVSGAQKAADKNRLLIVLGGLVAQYQRVPPLSSTASPSAPASRSPR